MTIDLGASCDSAASVPKISTWLGLIILWLAGANLRITVLAVPPVLPLIHDELHLSEKLVGALSSLPVLLLAVAAITGSLLTARLGARRALLVGLVLVAGAGAARGIGPSTSTLFTMTALMGLGIAIMQPVLPTLVRNWFPARIGLATAVYSNGLLVGEALSASLTIPYVLPLVNNDWAISFVFWSIPAVQTAIAVVLLTPRERQSTLPGGRAWWPDFRDPRVWGAGLILGGAGSGYFTSNAFLPDFLHQQGQTAFVNPALTALNLGQLPASFVILAFSSQLTGKRLPLLLAGAAMATSGIGLAMSPPGQLTCWWAGAMGFLTAFGLILSLALPALLAAPEDVPRFSAGMFTIGYLITFFAPIAGGAAWDLTQNASFAFAPPAVGGLIMALGAIGLASARRRT